MKLLTFVVHSVNHVESEKQTANVITELKCISTERLVFMWCLINAREWSTFLAYPNGIYRLVDITDEHRICVMRWISTQVSYDDCIRRYCRMYDLQLDSIHNPFTHSKDDYYEIINL